MKIGFRKYIKDFLLIPILLSESNEGLTWTQIKKKCKFSDTELGRMIEKCINAGSIKKKGKKYFFVKRNEPEFYNDPLKTAVFNEKISGYRAKEGDLQKIKSIKESWIHQIGAFGTIYGISPSEINDKKIKQKIYANFSKIESLFLSIIKEFLSNRIKLFKRDFNKSIEMISDKKIKNIFQNNKKVIISIITGSHISPTLSKKELEDLIGDILSTAKSYSIYLKGPKSRLRNNLILLNESEKTKFIVEIKNLVRLWEEYGEDPTCNISLMLGLS